MPVELFKADDGVHGQELWRTDGTAAGTWLVKDINAGSAASYPDHLTATAGLVFFVAETAVGNTTYTNLWRSDGTANGTIALTSGDSGSFPGSLIAVDQHLYFYAQNLQGGHSLYITDGTVAGTRELAAVENAANFAVVDHKLMFTASDASHGSEVWFSDGTVAGTKMAQDLNPGAAGSNPGELVRLGDLAIFAANDGVHGTELFLSGPGSNQVSLVRDIYTAGGSNPHGLTAAGSKVFFVVNNDDQGSNGLWVTGGYAGTTIRLAGNLATSGFTLGAAGDKLYYRTGDGVLHITNGSLNGTSSIATFSSFVSLHGVGPGASAVFDAYQTGLGEGIYLTDGTAAGTTRVADGAMVGPALAIGGKLYFEGYDGVHGAELWVSDGTLAGTHIVTDIIAGSASSDPYSFAEFDGRLVFRARSDAVNGELWISDGTAAGTHMVKDIRPGDHGGYLFASNLRAFGAKLIFTASAAWANGGVSVSDGTAAGTGALKAGGALSAQSYAEAGGKLYFIGSLDSAPAQLWVSSGVVGDAVAITSSATDAPAFLTAVGSSLYFVGTMPGQTHGLYVTDGVTTTLVATLSATSQPITLNGALLFTGTLPGGDTSLITVDPGNHVADTLAPLVFGGPLTLGGDGAHAFFTSFDTGGTELWVTDGAGPGTHRVADIAAGSTGSNILNIKAFAGGVLFTADDTLHGQEVWYSDGTAGGTHIIEVNTTTDGAAAFNQRGGYVSFGGKTYFQGADLTRGFELWSSDGTAAGTTLAVELAAGGESGLNPAGARVVGGKLLIEDNSGHLYLSDGTQGGTVKISETLGSNSLATSVMVGGKLYFVGYDGPNAVDITAGIFVTDGTVAGTLRINTQAPFALGVVGSELLYYGSDVPHGNGIFAYDTGTGATTFLGGNVAEHTASVFGVNVGSKVFFYGHDSAHGDELWITDGTAAGTSLVKDIGPGAVDAIISGMTAVGGKLLFNVNSGGLWKSDGTAAGTSQVATAQASNLTAVGSKAYFVMNDGSHGAELWSYDTAASALSIVQDLNVGGLGSDPGNLTAMGGSLYFTARTSNVSQANLYRANPGGGATALTNGSNGGNAGALTVMGGNLYFLGSDAGHGQGIFVTDGTTVSFVVQAAAGSLTAVGSSLYFLATDASNGLELWSSDGTAAGTHRLTDTRSPAGASLAASGAFTMAGGAAYFSANDGVHGQELWTISAGGAASLVADLKTGAGGSGPTAMTAMNGGLYFIATGDAGSAGVWSTHGAGATALTSATNGDHAQYLTAAGSHLFFYGSDSVHGAGLFVSDGSAGGTSFLMAFSQVQANSFAAVGETLYFNAYDDINKMELWKSDGTAAGTVRVTDTLDNQGSYPEGFATLRDFDPAAHDLDASGTDDILWRNDSGELYFYTMESPNAWNSGSVGSVGTDWHVQDMADYTGDGRADVLWRNNSGDLYIWNSVSGPGVHFAGQSISHVDLAWTVIGQAGDFNGDGRADILFRNTSGEVYLWNSNTGADTSFVGQSLGFVGNNWQIKGVGDFNGDGRADVLWREDGGDTYVWLDTATGPVAMSGLSITSTPNDWQIQGIGDFNGDGREDVLWRHDDGELYVWDSSTDSAAVNFTGHSLGMVDLGWSVAGIGDYDGDGRADILFRNGAGVTYAWFSNGSTGPETFFGRALGNVTTDWHILSDFHGM